MLAVKDASRDSLKHFRSNKLLTVLFSTLLFKSSLDCCFRANHSIEESKILVNDELR